MRISYKGDYALKTILELASHKRSELVNINELAKKLDIPKKFLEQILLELKKGGFVDSKRGQAGGYFLAEAPGQITIGAIIRFIDGPIEPIACVANNYQGCKDLSKCILRRVWQKTAQATAAIVDNITVEDLTNELKQHKRILSYSI